MHTSCVLETPFHSRTSALCVTNDWARWAGYTTVNTYYDAGLEYFAVRNQCGVFDMSPMIKYRINGKDALAYLNRLITRDVEALSEQQVMYVIWCDDHGKVLDDGTLFRFDENDFRLCAQDRHLPWLTSSAIGFDVEVTDETEKVAALAIQGPTSCAVLKELGLPNVQYLKPFTMNRYGYHGTDLVVSRTGFTGDLGYELWIEPEQAETLWDDLFEAGENHGISPYGSHALEMTRIEAGFLLPHADFTPAEHVLRKNRGRSPFELDLDWLVDFDKGNFNGRRALIKEKVLGSRYKLVWLDIEGNKPATDALLYDNQTTQVGHITSAMWSPTCKRNIAIGLVDANARTDRLWADIYVKKELKWLPTMSSCQVVERPFFNPSRRRATPAPNF